MAQQDLTGSYIADVPVISQNTAAVIRHKAKYYNGTASISIPLVKGSRYIILALITAGNTISIGFGAVAGTITDSRFTFTTASGPIDLSDFFDAAPFGQYKAPSEDFLYLIITGETDKAITAAISEMKS